MPAPEVLRVSGDPAHAVRRLLTIHAHPDDESSKGGGSIARYTAAGVGTALVCCTGGEAGSILNPAVDHPECRARLPEIRRAELSVGHATPWLSAGVDARLSRLQLSRPAASLARLPPPRWPTRYGPWSASFARSGRR